MHTVDVIGLCAVVLVVLIFAAILARQRHMLRLPGAIPLAVMLPARANRWLYGIGRYANGELRWYRAFGIGTRPTRVLRRREVQVQRRRAPLESERSSLPSNVVIIECTTTNGPISVALSEGAFTGFVSWLESSAPMA